MRISVESAFTSGATPLLMLCMLGAVRHVVGVRENVRRGLSHHHCHVGDLEKGDVVLGVAKGIDARGGHSLLLRERVKEGLGSPAFARAWHRELPAAVANVVVGKLPREKLARSQSGELRGEEVYFAESQTGINHDNRLSLDRDVLRDWNGLVGGHIADLDLGACCSDSLVDGNLLLADEGPSAGLDAGRALRR